MATAPDVKERDRPQNADPSFDEQQDAAAREDSHSLLAMLVVRCTLLALAAAIVAMIIATFS